MTETPTPPDPPDGNTPAEGRHRAPAGRSLDRLQLAGFDMDDEEEPVEH